MVGELSKITQIRKHIARDFAVDRAERDFLVHYLQVNLRELRKGLDDYINAERWDQIGWSADFLKSVGTNLQIDDLRQLGVVLAHCAEARDETSLSRTVARFDALLAELS